MKVLVDLCIVPLGVGVSLSPYIAACQKVLQEAGLVTSRKDGQWVHYTLRPAVIAAVAQGYLESGALPDLTSARIGLSRVTVMPMEGPAQLVVAIGALVYLVGMFAPLRSREGR